MKIYLSQEPPQDKSYSWAQNVVTLDGLALDSEATEIVCDRFLSMFTYAEIPKVLECIYKKMRTGCGLVIIEPDLNFIARHIIKYGPDPEHLSQTVFSGNVIKSMPTMDMITSMLPANMLVTHKNFDRELLRSILKIERKQ